MNPKKELLWGLWVVVLVAVGWGMASYQGCRLGYAVEPRGVSIGITSDWLCVCCQGLRTTEESDTASR